MISLTQTLLTVRVPVPGISVFVIVHVCCSPAAMVPVASPEPAAVCIQLPEKEGVKPEAIASLTVNEPGANVTAWLPPSVREKEDGGELVLITCTPNEGLSGHGPPPVDVAQTLFTISVPVVGAAAPPVLGTPLLTLFAALWLHELEMGLRAPTVSQFAF
ncbi:MAG TPA: hypothetical protein VH796_11385 [Nitrososphaeraceae archaeon]|jgi:hypothetical protein